MVRRTPRRSLLAELKRRRVYRVGAMYVAASFVVWQVADIVIPAFELPVVVMRMVVLAAVAGLPLALVLAWVYDLTPGGIRRTAELDAERDGSEADADPEPADPDARRGRRLATAGLLVLVVLAGVWWAVGDRLFPRAADPTELTLAVFPFAVRGGASIEYLREGAVDLLSRSLSGAADLTTLDPALVLRAAGGAERFEVGEAGAIARRIGAGQFVLGAVTQAGAQIRIDATLYALRDSIRTLPTRTVQGDTTRIFELIDQLTAALLAERSDGAASQRLVRTAAATTASLPALKAYLEGEQRFRGGVHEEGIGAFRRAIELDSTFALARYRLAVSHHMRGEHDIAYREGRRAHAHADRLGSHDRRQIDAFLAFHDGRVTIAERLLRELLAEYPRDLESRLILAELLTSYNPLRGQPLTEVRQHLETIIEADPQFACIYCQLGMVTLALEDYAAAEHWHRRAMGRRTGDTTRLDVRDQMVIGLRAQDTAKIRASIAAMDTLGPAAFSVHVQSYGTYALMSGAFDPFDELRGAAAARNVDPAARDLLELLDGIARGRWRAAAEVAVRLADSGADRAEWLAWQLLLAGPFDAAVVADERLRPRLAAGLERARAAATEAPPHAATPGGADEAQRRRIAEAQFALALLAARAGDAATARALADSIAAAARASTLYRAGIDGLSRTVRADLILRSGNAQAALRELESLSVDIPLDMALGASYGGRYAAVLRAHAHAALGQHEQAHRWLRHGTTFLGMPLAMRYGVWHRDMAYALEGMGQDEQARRHFARFVAAWAGADPELMPQVDAARRRLGER